MRLGQHRPRRRASARWRRRRPPRGRWGHAGLQPPGGRAAQGSRWSRRSAPRRAVRRPAEPRVGPHRQRPARRDGGSRRSPPARWCGRAAGPGSQSDSWPVEIGQAEALGDLLQVVARLELRQVGASLPPHPGLGIEDPPVGLEDAPAQRPAQLPARHALGRHLVGPDRRRRCRRTGADRRACSGAGPRDESRTTRGGPAPGWRRPGRRRPAPVRGDAGGALRLPGGRGALAQQAGQGGQGAVRVVGGRGHVAARGAPAGRADRPA